MRLKILERKNIKIKNKNDMAYRKVISEYNEIKILIKERLGRWIENIILFLGEISEEKVNEETNNYDSNNIFKCGIIPSTLIGLSGLFKGEVPDELKDLSYIETSMISIYSPVTKVKIEGNIFNIIKFII